MPSVAPLPPITQNRVGERLDKLLSFEEFQSLAAETAPKVNLFGDSWKENPAAEFFGGTTRDYLYWLSGKFRGAQTREEALKIRDAIRTIPFIDVKEFIVHDSDVDVVSERPIRLNSSDYGVKKIDFINGDRFNPGTTAGIDEIRQGVIPVEKIRLGKTGLIPWAGVGDGAKEIYNGAISVRFPNPRDFAETHFAKQKLNHPILLALRYMRLHAIEYYKRHGASLPSQELLFRMDPAIEKKLHEIVQTTLRDPTFKEYLAQPKFLKWLNASIRKTCASYTNPTAAKLLLDRFGVNDLVEIYPEIKTYNQFLFGKYRDDSTIARNLRTLGTSPKKLFIPVAAGIKGGKLYHGTRTPASFRNILFQGVLPSEVGLAGQGLYGVAHHNIKFAEAWGGDPNRVIEFDIKPTAKLVDITKGEGEKMYAAYVSLGHPANETAFADFVGADIVRYEYDNEAFVVKNSEVLHRARGHKIQLLTTSALIERARSVRTEEELATFLETVRINNPSTGGLEIILDTLTTEGRNPWLRMALEGRIEKNKPAQLRMVSSFFGLSPDLDRKIAPIFGQRLREMVEDQGLQSLPPYLKGVLSAKLSAELERPLANSISKLVASHLGELPPKEILPLFLHLYESSMEENTVSPFHLTLSPILDEILDQEQRAFLSQADAFVPKIWIEKVLKISNLEQTRKLAKAVLKKNPKNAAAFLRTYAQLDPVIMTQELQNIAQSQIRQISPDVRNQLGQLEDGELIRRASLFKRFGTEAFAPMPPFRVDTASKVAPELQSISYLRTALRAGRNVSLADTKAIAALWQAVNPQNLNQATQKRLDQEIHLLMTESVDYETTLRTLERSELKSSILKVLPSDPSKAFSAAWWMNRKPFPSLGKTKGTGRTALELGIEIVYQRVDSMTELNALMRSAKPNALIADVDIAGVRAAYGPGFYTDLRKPNSGPHGIFASYHVDPKAMKGTDFQLIGDRVIWHNRDSLRGTGVNLEDLESVLGLADDLNKNGGQNDLVRHLAQQSKSPLRVQDKVTLANPKACELNYGALKPE